MEDQKPLYRIGDFARKAGVTTRTLRYYELFNKERITFRKNSNEL